MATTFDKASLVMIPSGYKDDKLYSVKPTDGSGDFTFSRDGAGASPATRVNASGLIEKGRENVLLQSNQFDTTWITTSASVTSGQSGYDGSSDAWLFSKSGSNGRIYQNNSFNSVGTFSIYAKAGTTDWIWIRDNNGVGSYFDLGNGVVGTTTSGLIERKIEDIGSGWYRCSITAAFNFANMRLYVADGDGVTSGTTGNIYIQDAQLEQGLVATDYIETITAPVSAGLLGDMPRLDYSGGATCPSLLLEPSRVNIITNSEYIGGSDWTRNGFTLTTNTTETLSPEGVYNASKLDVTNTDPYLLTLPAASVAVGSVTFSGYLKGAGTALGKEGGIYIDFGAGGGTATGTNSSASYTITDEWVRWETTANVTGAGTIRFRIEATNIGAASGDDVYVYGLQAESGSYPTSYIPTYGSAAPRAADSYYNNNLASLHDTANGFCLMFDYSEVEEGDSAFQDYFSIQQAFNNDTGFRAEAAGTSNSEWRLYTDNITTTLGFPMTLSNIASRRKVLVKIESTGIKIFADGSLITSQSGSVTIPTLGTLQPSRSTTQPALTGIKQSLGLVFFSPILTDAECIALTTI